MIRASVGVSRKMSRDFNSAGFSLTLDAEIQASLDDPEAVIERVREVFALAEEALNRQIAESREIDAVARREVDPDTRQRPGDDSDRSAPSPRRDAPESRPGSGHRDGGGSGREEPATPKQLKFVETLGRRHRVTGPRLQTLVREIVDRPCSLDDLTKREAGLVIERLSAEEPALPARR